MQTRDLRMPLLRHHSKERSDMILEPLHVIIKLAMIEFYPIGTKLTIADNTVHI